MLSWILLYVFSHYCDFLTYFSPILSLSQHVQSVLQTLEEQVAGERQRLVETHLARVVATLNNNRRLALESYLSAVQSDPPQVCPSYRELLWEYEQNTIFAICKLHIFYFIVINIYPKCLKLHSRYHSCQSVSQFLLSVGIEPVTLLFLVPSSTVWATAKRLLIFSYLIVHVVEY